jgi:hypothetical protein
MYPSTPPLAYALRGHLVTHGRVLIRSINLRKLLVLLLPPVGVPNTKAMLKDLANILKRHTLDLREAKDNKQPANKAYAGVEAEGTGGSDPFHHGQERGRNDDVGRPACDGVQHGTDSANFHGDQLSCPGSVSWTVGEWGWRGWTYCQSMQR